MKAIVIAVKNGTTEFLPFENEEIYTQFRKLCHNSGMAYIESEESFEELKDNFIPLEIDKKYQGAGIYDFDGDLHEMLKDENETSYHIIENYNENYNEKNIDLIKSLKDIIVENNLIMS